MQHLNLNNSGGFTKQRVDKLMQHSAAYKESNQKKQFENFSLNQPSAQKKVSIEKLNLQLITQQPYPFAQPIAIKP